MTKKLLHLVGRSHANPHLPVPVERGASESESSSLPHGSRKGLLPKLRDKLANRSARSARQSPNPEPAAASTSAQDLMHTGTTQDASPFTAPTPEPNPDQSSSAGITNAEQPDPKSVNQRIIDATKGVAGMKNVAGVVENTASAPNNLQSVSDAIDTFSPILAPLKVFNSIAERLADLHPYAKVALSIFTYASNMILDQASRDAAVASLLAKISAVYALLTKEEALARISSMVEIYGKMSRQMLECADFIVHYSDMKGFWKRLGKHVLKETEATIQSYNDVLDNLMQQFRDQVSIDTVVTVHRIAEDLDISSMNCVGGAGRNTSKNCLPGTREDILSEIKCWIRSTGEDVPRVLWLSGTAGKGKSAIAHTIANWSHERGGLRACFCFDRTREAERRHEKIFTTIARNLADCDLTMRGALARAVHADNELKDTIDISRQWQELVVGPIGEASKAITAPVLIIIDALDESSDAQSRAQILHLLTGNPNTSSPQLPANFRIIVTSRPLRDIGDGLQTGSHVRHISLDEIPVECTEHDIEIYISTMLQGPRNPFDDGHFKTLAQKSDGMFEWARLACEYIKRTNKVGADPMARFKALVTGTSKDQKGTHLLDDMYRLILAEIMSEDEEAITLFRSVMGQVVASLEPLSMSALTAMRLQFPLEGDRYQVDWVLGPMGSLIAGTTDSQTLIRPLHASFYDFLTDKSRSHDFFVDAPSVQSDLAFASLRVMERGLRFNICSLESSYLANSAVPDLERRVKDSIPTALSYSCRFWGSHLGATSFQPSIAEEVEAFFDGERLLWWLEALSLMKSLGGAVGCLSSIANWFTGHVEYTPIGDATRDTLRFVRTFAPTIVHSTPHLYLSALPFAPTQSKIFQKFAAQFPRTPRIVAGHVVKWPQMEKILHWCSEVWSVAMSPDGKRIACGSRNGMIQVWDMETGEALGAPLQGHTGCVASVAFSPDGKRIVSGSWDRTVRVWDAVTGKALGSPLEGHTHAVMSVAISPDGNHIVSGSDDGTIRVWHMETGKALQTVLQGHTCCVYSVAISPNGNHIVSGSFDNTIWVWDMWTGEALGVPLQGHTASIRSVAISPDGKHIVSGSDDNTIRIWDLETGEAFGAPLQGHTASIQSIAISSDGNHIVSGSDDQTIRVWDAKTGEASGSPLQGHTNSVTSVAISPDGNRIVSGSYDTTIRVWDAETNTAEALGAAFQCHTASVNSVAISPDGHHIVSGSSDKTVRMWDMETGEALGVPLQEHTDSVLLVAISPDRHRVIFCSDDKIIWVWNVETGEASVVPLQGGTDSAQCVDISPDGHHIVLGFPDSIRMWDVETGEVSSTIRVQHAETGDTSDPPPGSPSDVAVSPDAKHIVSSSSDMSLQVWDVQASKALGAPLQGQIGGVCSVSISPDGKCIMSGFSDNTIRVWDLETREALVALFQGHSGPVWSVAMSPNGKHIVSGSADRTIRVWDMETGEPLASLSGHTDSVWSVAISPDGKRIVSSSNDKTIRVWDLGFLTLHQPFKTSAICFSPNQAHALHSASSFLQDSSTPASLAANEEGWVVGPDGRLLLCIPLNFHPVIYAPGNTLVISNDVSHFDLSRLAHGTSWHKCREQKVTLSSH